jgi:hypothetical protein
LVGLQIFSFGITLLLYTQNSILRLEIDIFTSLSLPIIIAVIVAGIMGFILLSMSGGKINYDNSTDDIIDEEDSERSLNDVSGAGGDHSTLPKI